jgi:hypothetical protein
MSSNAQICVTALLLGGLLLGGGGCAQRTLQAGEDEDEIAKVCEQSCPLQFECGFAREGKTLKDCLEGCPVFWKARRDECRAEFEKFACLSTLSCEEYFAYVEALDRKIGTFGDPPPFPCQAEVITAARECHGVDNL